LMSKAEILLAPMTFWFSMAEGVPSTLIPTVSWFSTAEVVPAPLDIFAATAHRFATAETVTYVPPLNHFPCECPTLKIKYWHCPKNHQILLVMETIPSLFQCSGTRDRWKELLPMAQASTDHISGLWDVPIIDKTVTLGQFIQYIHGSSSPRLKLLSRKHCQRLTYLPTTFPGHGM
jgi:hypothetical protein